MKLKYLGIYYPTELHTQGEPYETSTDVLQSDVTDHNIDMDNTLVNSSAWSGASDDIKAISDATAYDCGTSYLLKQVGEDFRVWELRA